MIHIPDMRKLIEEILGEMGDKFAHFDAVALVHRTGAAESEYFYQFQIGGGPGRGLWQLETDTAKDILLRYLLRSDKSDLRKTVEYLLGMPSRFDEDTQTRSGGIEAFKDSHLLDMHLRGNEILGIILCRLKYWPKPYPIPGAPFVDLQAQYWLTHYNAGGAGSIKRFVAAAGKVEQ